MADLKVSQTDNHQDKIADGLILNSIGTEQYFKHAISVLNNSAREGNRDTRKGRNTR